MFTLVKLREEDGSIGWVARVTNGWSQEEGLAVLLSYVDNLRREAADDWDEGYTTPRRRSSRLGSARGLLPSVSSSCSLRVQTPEAIKRRVGGTVRGLRIWRRPTSSPTTRSAAVLMRFNSAGSSMLGTAVERGLTGKLSIIVSSSDGQNLGVRPEDVHRPRSRFPIGLREPEAEQGRNQIDDHDVRLKQDHRHLVSRRARVPYLDTPAEMKVL